MVKWSELRLYYWQSTASWLHEYEHPPRRHHHHGRTNGFTSQLQKIQDLETCWTKVHELSTWDYLITWTEERLASVPRRESIDAGQIRGHQRTAIFCKVVETTRHKWGDVNQVGSGYPVVSPVIHLEPIAVKILGIFQIIRSTQWPGLVHIIPSTIYPLFALKASDWGVLFQLWDS